MRDTNFFTRDIEARESPGLDSTDPRLSALVDLADQGNHAAAADMAMELSEQGIFDIRPISYFLYQAFREDGMGALPGILAAALALIGKNAPAIGPEKRRREHFDKRFTWLFETIADALLYHEKNRTAEWSSWQADLLGSASRESIEPAERAWREFSEGGYRGAAERLGKLLAWLREHVTEMKAETVKEELKSAPVGEAPPAEVHTRHAPAPTRMELVVSPYFLELLAKLRVFEQLVERGALEKAAVVADDIQGALERFDPCVHFPATFARFFALLSENIQPISEHMEGRESPAWKALAKYYRVDLDGFVGD